MATHSSILAWKISRTEEPGGLHTVRGVAKSQTWLRTCTHNWEFRLLRTQVAWNEILFHLGGKNPYCYLWNSLREIRASPVAQLVNNLPAMRKTWVRPLGREDPLEKGRATHSSILAWIGSQRVRHDWATFTSLSLFTFLLQWLE